MKPALAWGRIDGWIGRAAWQDKLPGIAVAAALAWVAGWIADGLGDPLARNPVLVAMLLGLAIGNLFGCPQALQPGLAASGGVAGRCSTAAVGVTTMRSSPRAEAAVPSTIRL